MTINKWKHLGWKWQNTDERNKRDLSKWRNTLFGIRRLSIPKISVFLVPPNWISTISIQFQQLCSGDDRLNVKFTLKGKGATITIKILKNENKQRNRPVGLPCPNVRTGCPPAAVTTGRHPPCDQQVVGGRRAQRRRHTQWLVTSCRGTKAFSIQKSSLSINAVGWLKYSCAKKKLVHILLKIQTILPNEWQTLT